MIGARAVLAAVSEFAAVGPTDLRAEAAAVLDVLLRAFNARDIEAIRAVTRQTGSLLDRIAIRISHPLEGA